jgi:hypothetical protein
VLTWERAKLDRSCGGCLRRIGIGDPILVITIGKLVKVRCVVCEGPPPFELPPLVERTPIEPRPRIPVQSIAHMLPLDWRRRQAGED